MRLISFLIAACALNSSPAFAESPERRVILASNAARALIVEAKADGRFWFERCFLPNSATKTIAQELSEADYKDCVEINRQLPDTEAVRAEFNRQFGESLNEFFERHSKTAATGRTVMAGVVGLFVGGGVPLLPIRYVHSTSTRRMVASALVTGGLSAFLMGRYAVDHVDELGLGREVEEALDSDLNGDVIFLDKQVKGPHHASEAVGVFELALDDATQATGSKHLN